MTNDQPSTHGPNGRDTVGRFAPGNRLGKGNPLAGRAAKLRAALLRRVKRADVEAIADKLVVMAKAGDLAAMKELLNRVVGVPVASDILERIEAIEATLAAEEDR